MPVTYSAFRVEKPTSRISLSAAAAMRSRVGNAHASPCRTPNRSIRRDRTANAEWSDTCCEVIRPTSISHGSGTSGGR